MLVSVSISEIAVLSGKSSKTLVRWCKKGFVRGARRSKGGHWRVRVSILENDKLRAKALARRSNDYQSEIAGIVLEKAIAALRPPKGFDRARKPSAEALAPFYTEIEALLPFRITRPGIAEKVAAVREFAEVIGEPDTDLKGQRLAVARRQGLLVFKRAPDNEPLPEVYAKASRAAVYDAEGAALRSAITNLMRESKRVSVNSVCARLGWSRATIYRQGKHAEISAIIESVEESSRKAAGEEALKLAGVAQSPTIGKARKTVSRLPEKKGGLLVTFAEPIQKESSGGFVQHVPAINAKPLQRRIGAALRCQECGDSFRGLEPDERGRILCEECRIELDAL